MVIMHETKSQEKERRREEKKRKKPVKKRAKKSCEKWWRTKVKRKKVFLQSGEEKVRGEREKIGNNDSTNK